MSVPGKEPFRSAAETLLKESGCTVRKWRTRNTGRAFTRAADWGIEVPEPRGPLSFGTFAHEIGHQMLHREGTRQRWLEELEAWEYALAQFERFNLPGFDKSQFDAAKCLVYAAAKANRRCSPEVAARILDRMPSWVWAAEIDRSCVEHLDRLSAVQPEGETGEHRSDGRQGSQRSRHRHRLQDAGRAVGTGGVVKKPLSLARIVKNQPDDDLAQWFGVVVEEIARRTGQSTDEAMYALAAAYWDTDETAAGRDEQETA